MTATAINKSQGGASPGGAAMGVAASAGAGVRRKGGAKRKPPLGVAWRIRAVGPWLEHETLSADYRPVLNEDPSRRLKRRTTFDELVVLGPRGQLAIHVEQMDERTYFVALGDEKRMVRVDRKGRVVVGEMYR